MSNNKIRNKMVNVLHTMKNQKKIMDIMKLNLYLDQKIQNDVEIGTEIDWLVEITSLKQNGNVLINNYGNTISKYTSLLIQCITEENYELADKLQQVIDIETRDIFKLIKERPIKENKEELLQDLKEIRLSEKQRLDEFIIILQLKNKQNDRNNKK